ncbi:MAG TPA: ArsR family transcriptional regulator [Longimicrobiales bacterium]|nr:ArsR family transcriptional regulator [Longimicrobiales bacterium]
MARPWRERILASTRGRVLSLLRWGPRTVNELASALELTDNAVRLHLSSLERDGLIEQEGVRRGGGKPAHVYRLTGEADSLFPKAYATVLSEVLAYVREEQGDEGLELFLRQVGRRAGARARAGAPTLRDRVDAAVALLGELGGLAEVEAAGDALIIRGFSCPLAAIVGANPEACALAAELVSGVVGVPVHECCERGEVPRCSFLVTPSRS